MSSANELEHARWGDANPLSPPAHGIAVVRPALSLASHCPGLFATSLMGAPDG